MTVIVSTIVDMYISRARKLLDFSDDQTSYDVDKAIAIELALGNYGYSSEGELPSSNNTVYKKLIATRAASELLTALSFAVLAAPIEKVGDASIKASFEARQRNIEKLRGFLEQDMERLEKTLNINSITGNKMVGPILMPVMVDTTIAYYPDGTQVVPTASDLFGE